MYYEMKYDSPVGRLTMASDGSNLAGLWMGKNTLEAL